MQFCVILKWMTQCKKYIRKKKYPSGNIGIIVLRNLWVALKGYLTNTDMPLDQVYAAWKNRGTRVHLFCGSESIQRTGAIAPTIRNKNEC